MFELLDLLEDEGIDILNHEVFNYNGNEYLVVAGIEKDYINIYVANEKYKIGTLDCLDNQIDNTPQKREKFMNKKELEKVAIRFYLWDKYSINDEIRTFNVVEYDEGGSVVWVWENIQLLNMVYY